MTEDDEATVQELQQRIQIPVSKLQEHIVGEDKIHTVESWRRGEISEDEARDRLGDDVIDRMLEDIDAFRDAMNRDTAEFLQDE